MDTFIGFNLYKFERDNTGRRSWADLTTFIKANPTVEDIDNLGKAVIGLFRKGFQPCLEDRRYKGVINMTIMHVDFVSKVRQLAMDAVIDDPHFAGFYRGFKRSGIKIFVPNEADSDLQLKHFGAYSNEINYQSKKQYQKKLRNYK